MKIESVILKKNIQLYRSQNKNVKAFKDIYAMHSNQQPEPETNLTRLLKTRFRYTIQITAALQRYSDNRTYSIKLNRFSKKSGKQYATIKTHRSLL